MEGLSIVVRLEKRMGSIADSIQYCGQLCDTYHKSHSVCESCYRFLFVVYANSSPAKFFKSLQWKEKFVLIAQTFAVHKDALALDLQLHLNVVAVQMVDSVNIIRRDVAQMKTTLEKLMDAVFSRLRTVDERKFDVIVGDRGVNELQTNDELLREVLSTLRTTDPQRKTGRVQGDDADVFSRIKKELDEDMEKIIKNNRAFFRELEVVRKSMGDINVSIARSAETIVKNVNQGPYCGRIHNPVSSYWSECSCGSV